MDNDMPQGGGLPIPRKYAIALLKAGLGHSDGDAVRLMCYEYGKNQGCDECKGDCVCWNGMTPDDLTENGNGRLTLDEDYRTFELWI